MTPVDPDETRAFLTWLESKGFGVTLTPDAADLQVVCLDSLSPAERSRVDRDSIFAAEMFVELCQALSGERATR